MSITQETSWNNFDEVSHTEDTDSISGSGGDVLAIWKDTRQNKLDKLASSTFTNNSSFEIPKAVVSNGWANGWKSGENFHGITVIATPLAADGSPLSGTAKITAGGETVDEKKTSGSFSFSSIPPAGTYLGGSVPTQAYSFEYHPTVDAIAITKDDISTTENLGTIQYGAIDGTVTDYNGDPMPNTVVSATGAGTITGEDGKYNFQAPGGNTVTMTTLGGTYDFDVTPSSGTTITQDVQASRVVVRLRDAAFEPISNAPVEINGKGYRTDESGRVEINEAILSDYGVIVMDKFKTVVDVDSAGTEFIVTLGPGSSDFVNTDSDFSGFEMEVLDKYSNEPIEDLKVVDLIGESVSYTDGEGRCRILSIREGGGKIAAVVGRGDNRYKELQLAAEATSEMISEEVKVQRKTPAGTR